MQIHGLAVSILCGGRKIRALASKVNRRARNSQIKQTYGTYASTITSMKRGLSRRAVSTHRSPVARVRVMRTFYSFVHPYSIIFVRESEKEKEIKRERKRETQIISLSLS